MYAIPQRGLAGETHTLVQSQSMRNPLALTHFAITSGGGRERGMNRGEENVKDEGAEKREG